MVADPPAAGKQSENQNEEPKPDFLNLPEQHDAVRSIEKELSKQCDTQKIEVVDEHVVDTNLQSLMKEMTMNYQTEEDQADSLEPAGSKGTVAVTIEQKIQELLDKTVLDENDLITEDELLKLRYERMQEVYRNIERN